MTDKNPMHGIWRILPSVYIAEIIAKSGFDFQILDCEHGPYTTSELIAEIAVCQLNRCIPLVRVSQLNKAEVQRALDIGAEGIVFPGLTTYDDFCQAAAFMDYAPAGSRGFNPFVRSKNYGAPENIERPLPYCITIVETLEAVQKLDQILDIERIDTIYIGTYDLSAQLGIIGQMDAPQLVELTQRISTKAISKGKKVAVMASNVDGYKNASANGISAFVHSVDTNQIQILFKSILNPFRKNGDGK